MSTVGSQEMRRLCDDYYHGLLGRAEYRQLRGQLVTQILAGDANVATTTATVPAAREPSSKEINQARTGDESEGRRTVRYVAATFVVLCLAAVGWWWFADYANQPAELTEPAPDRATELNDPLGFIKSFTATPDWSPALISRFLGEWDALSDSARQAAIDSMAYDELRREIIARVREQRALLPSRSNDADLNDIWRLTALAAELEIELPGGFEQRPAAEPVAANQSAGEAKPAEPVASASSPPEPAKEKASESENNEADAAGTAKAEPIQLLSADDIDSNPPGAVEAASAISATVAEAAQVSTQTAALAASEDSLQSSPPADQPADTLSEVPPEATGSDQQSPVNNVQPESRWSSGRECRRAQLETRRRACWDMIAEDKQGPVMIILPPGQFVMGDDGDKDLPTREVEIAHPFAVSAWEVSYSEYAEFCSATGRACPAKAWSDVSPVVEVNWQDAADYAAWLTDRTGYRYRLPTEAEWEYAARAGSTTLFPYGDELFPADARFRSEIAFNAPLPQTDKTTKRNAFNLWHMAGNVREWVQDTWDDSSAVEAASSGSLSSLKVVRGGSFADRVDALRSAARYPLEQTTRDRWTGIRLVREVHD